MNLLRMKLIHGGGCGMYFMAVYSIMDTKFQRRIFVSVTQSLDRNALWRISWFTSVRKHIALIDLNKLSASCTT